MSVDDRVDGLDEASKYSRPLVIRPGRWLPGWRLRMPRSEVGSLYFLAAFLVPAYTLPFVIGIGF